MTWWDTESIWKLKVTFTDSRNQWVYSTSIFVHVGDVDSDKCTLFPLGTSSTECSLDQWATEPRGWVLTICCPNSFYTLKQKRLLYFTNKLQLSLLVHSSYMWKKTSCHCRTKAARTNRAARRHWTMLELGKNKCLEVNEEKQHARKMFLLFSWHKMSFTVLSAFTAAQPPKGKRQKFKLFHIINKQQSILTANWTNNVWDWGKWLCYQSFIWNVLTREGCGQTKIQVVWND